MQSEKIFSDSVLIAYRYDPPSNLLLHWTKIIYLSSSICSHPTLSASAAEILAVLFFNELHYTSKFVFWREDIGGRSWGEEGEGDCAR